MERPEKEKLPESNVEDNEKKVEKVSSLSPICYPNKPERKKYDSIVSSFHVCKNDEHIHNQTDD